MYSRTDYLNKLLAFKDTDFVKVITGVRRCGKSVILQQYMDSLRELGVPDSHIIYINLESFEYRDVLTDSNLMDVICSKMHSGKNRSGKNPNGSENSNNGKSQQTTANQQKTYILIDEIQFVDGWQKAINALRVSFNCDIVITGSNAKLLSGELATNLSGRYVEIPVYPFSFKEFLGAKQIDVNSREVDLAYKEYEQYGGFPSVVLADEPLRYTILSGIYDSIILNDIAARAQIKDSFTLKRIVAFLADNVGQLVNASKVTSLLKNERIEVSNHTISRYLELLQNAYLFFEVRPYDIRGKAYLRQNAKYFIVDSGLRNQAVSHRLGNIGNRLENIVFLELLRRGYDVDVARVEGSEVDFIARKGDLVEYYQVTQQLPENTHETDNLLKLRDNYAKFLITGRYAGVDLIDGIHVKYVVDWLIDKS